MTAGIWDTVAGEYEASGVSFFAPAGRTLVGLAALRPGDRVLDVATGRGHVLHPAAEAVGRAGLVVGVDVAERMLRLTRTELASSRVGLLLADAHEPPFADATFDAVTAGFVVFMLDRPEQAIGRWLRLLGPGGVLAFTSYGPEDDRFTALREILAEARGATRQLPAPDPWEDPANLRRTLAAAGYVEATVQTKRIELRFDSLDQWWAWARSVALRAAIDQLTTEQLRACDARVAPTLGGDGNLSLSLVVHFTTARHP